MFGLFGAKSAREKRRIGGVHLRRRKEAGGKTRRISYGRFPKTNMVNLYLKKLARVVEDVVSESSNSKVQWRWVVKAKSNRTKE